MSYVNPYLMSIMRQTAEDALTDTAQIRRKTAVSRTSAGGSSFTWSTVHAYPCRVVPVQRLPREVEQERQVTAVGLWNILVPYTADVLPEDRVWVNGGPDAGGSEFEVTATDNAQSESVLQQVQAKRLN